MFWDQHYAQNCFCFWTSINKHATCLPMEHLCPATTLPLPFQLRDWIIKISILEICVRKSISCGRNGKQSGRKRQPKPLAIIHSNRSFSYLQFWRHNSYMMMKYHSWPNLTCLISMWHVQTASLHIICPDKWSQMSSEENMRAGLVPACIMTEKQITVRGSPCHHPAPGSGSDWKDCCPAPRSPLPPRPLAPHTQTPLQIPSAWPTPPLFNARNVSHCHTWLVLCL